MMASAEAINQIAEELDKVNHRISSMIDIIGFCRGQRPDMMPRIDYRDGIFHISYGAVEQMPLTTDMEVLVPAGFRFSFAYARDYFDPANNEIVTLLPHEVRRALPKIVRYEYDLPEGSFGLHEIEDELTNEPLPQGGVTYARVYAPYGAWAVGEAYCSDQDNFDKAVGRKLALERAFEKLNEIRDRLDG